ncbi:MAG TPA: hypothetical protein VLX68_12360 [Chitinivibrionales bacterium]|nr:hypothetical protein [Chitinivibrionales bacterium]
MSKIFLPIILAALAVRGQDITASDSTIQIYNNSLMSFADGVQFTSHSPATIHLDSAVVHVDTMDTTGMQSPVPQLSWKNEDPIQAQFVWRMDSTGSNNYRLTKIAFAPLNAQPLSFSGTDTTEAIFMVEIGFLYPLDMAPKFVRTFRGSLKLFFSNGQIMTLGLTAHDLNAGVKRQVMGAGGNKTSGAGMMSYKNKVRCLVNGRKVDGDEMRAGKRDMLKVVGR